MSSQKWQVLQWAGRLVKYATMSALSDKFGYGYVSAPAEDASMGDKSTQQRVRFMQWFGFRSAPVVDQGECIVVAPRGGASNAVALAADNLSVGPTDLKEGEVVLYAKSGQVIRLHDDGSITVVPKPGAKVKLGDSDDANLDQVVTLVRLQTDFNNLVNKFNSHSHLAGTLSAPMGGGAVTGATATNAFTANQLSNAAGSPNVVAKK